MRRCDGVMASGHSVDTFAIPALQPLVLNLFVRPGSEGVELETQREVVLSMLLRVVDHSRVLSLLTHVLDCFSHSAQHWHRVSCTLALWPEVAGHVHVQPVIFCRCPVRSLPPC